MSTQFYQRFDTDFGRIEVVTSGVTDHHFPRHFHENFPFGVVEAGVLGFTYRGEKLAAWQGTINLANPGEIHDGFPLDAAGWRYRMFYVDCNFIREVTGKTHDGAAFPWFSSGVIQDQALAGLIAHLHRQIQSGLISQLALESTLFSLLETMIGRYAQVRLPEPRSVKQYEQMGKVCEYIRATSQESLSLKFLSDLFGFSPGYFIRAFRSFSGMTPHQYQLVCRLQNAKAQVLYGIPIIQAAMQNGFVDQSHFTHAFKQFYGYAPGMMRSNRSI